MSKDRTSGLDAKEQLAALGQMTGELIHDLANEMTVLQAWALLARGEQEAGRSASSEMDRVLEISTDLGVMMRDILETVGGRTLSPEADFDPVRLTETALNQRVRELSGITVRFESFLPGEVKVGGRSSFWSRSVRNLLSNAARHARREIAVTLREVRGERGRQVVLRIEDDGPGVSPDRRDAIFRPLVRGDDGEVGLGLSSVVWATGQLGGEISCEPGEVLGGAAFEIRVPMARPTAAPRGIEGIPAARYLDRMRIVLIENDPSVRRSLKRLLSRFGAEVLDLIAEDGDGDLLLSRVEGALPDMILLNLEPGKQGGLSLWNRMCLDCPELADLVVFTGGDADIDPGWQLAQHTGQPFLAKPYVLGDLAAIARSFRRSD
jgi:CheY-like chemotaxis protein